MNTPTVMGAMTIHFRLAVDGSEGVLIAGSGPGRGGAGRAAPVIENSTEGRKRPSPFEVILKLV